MVIVYIESERVPKVSPLAANEAEKFLSKFKIPFKAAEAELALFDIVYEQFEDLSQ